MFSGILNTFTLANVFCVRHDALAQIKSKYICFGRVLVKMRKTKLAASVLAITASVGIHSALADNHMVKYKIEDDAIKASLTGKAGDVAKGRKLATNRKKGNCLACHVVSDLKEQQFHGKIAPPLDGAADRYSEGELRLRLVNPKTANEDTIMPSFYEAASLHRVMKKFKGKTILSAQEVEDVLAYVMTLK